MKTYLQIILPLFFICTIFIGCSSDNDALSSPAADCPDLSVGNAEEHYLSNQAYGIDSIYMTNQCMNIAVAYSGGCEDHAFNLWWDEQYETILNDGVKSIKAVLYLVHAHNGDYCEALIRDHYSFDVNSLRHDSFGEVAIEVFSTDSSYLYQYRY